MGNAPVRHSSLATRHCFLVASPFWPGVSGFSRAEAGAAQTEMNSAPQPELLPLCVDLDGTLVQTDTLLESALALLRRNIFYVAAFALWLLRGRACLKRRIAERSSLDVTLLPYNQGVLALLRQESARGRHLVLATAADRLIAEKVAAHLGCFNEVLASDGSLNLKGRAKLRALEARFGQRGFQYAGNSRADLPLWSASDDPVVVGASPSLVFRLGGARVIGVAPTLGQRVALLLKAMRFKQWVKNILLFVPLITAHKWASGHMVGKALLCFLAFGLCASSNYLLNDLFDLAADRQHARKRFRPFASGLLPIHWGLIAMPLTFAAGIACAILTSSGFLIYLGVYMVCAIFYSARLKREVLADVLLLAALYDLRIMAGGAAAGVPISEWLLAFSMFLFLSLALVKRYSELSAVRARNGSADSGRGYRTGDLELLLALGTGSGYLSVLVLALYVNSPEVRALYLRPHLLWLMCPVFLYWISRVWLLAHRGEVDEDPVVFALEDKVSYLAGAVTAAVMLAAM